MTDPVVVAEVVRSGFVESRHRGALVALDADGGEAFRFGDPDQVVFPRSSNKPLQAAGMVRAGLALDGPLLALVAGSHSGEGFHVEGVQQILRDAGLTEAALQNPPSWPLDDAARVAAIRAGGAPSALTMNCSGKHSGMLATCVANGWPTDTYLHPGHPLQTALRATVEELAGMPVTQIGVDGCGAPLFALSLTALARAYRALVLAAEGSAERRVADAMRANPQWCSGTGRDEAELMRGVPGLLVKAGAEGCYAAALSDGRAVAVKIEDGGQRARSVVMAAALRRLGVVAPVVDAQTTAPVTGGCRPVGQVRAVGF